MPSQFLPQKTIALFEQEALNLPVYLRDALNEFEWQDLTVAVGAKYHLTHDQVIKLLVEVGMMLYGVGDPATFRTDVQSRLGVSVDVLDGIIRDIADRVFMPMQEYILENNGPTVEYLQNEVAQLEHEQMLQSAIPDTDDEEESPQDELLGQVPLAPLAPEMPAEKKQYTEHDPYHEPVETA